MTLLEWPDDVPEHHPIEAYIGEFHYTQFVTGEALSSWREAWESFVYYGWFPGLYGTIGADPCYREIVGLEPIPGEHELIVP